MPRRRYRDEEDEENDAWEWIDDNVLSRVVLDDGDELEAIQALAEAQFLVERAREIGFSEKTRAGKLAAVIERKVLLLGDDASRSFVKAITACVDACKRAKVIPAKRVQLFERQLKRNLIARARATRRQTEGAVSLQYFPEDVVTEILTRCDAKTRSVLCCVAKAFRDADKRVGTLSRDDLSSHPRATCTKCHEYVWVSDLPRCQTACNGKKRAAHAWKSSIETWRRDLLVCVGMEDAESDGEDEEIAELIGKKFWKISVVDE